MDALKAAAGGLCVAVFGAVVASIAVTYPLGNLGRMGPGFMPLFCGIALTVIGLLIAATEARAKLPDRDAIRLRPFVAVFTGLVTWALLAPRYGLVPATAALVIIVAFAQGRPRPINTIITAAVLSVIGVSVFIWGLGIRLEAVRY